MSEQKNQQEIESYEEQFIEQQQEYAQLNQQEQRKLYKDLQKGLKTPSESNQYQNQIILENTKEHTQTHMNLNKSQDQEEYQNQQGQNKSNSNHSKGQRQDQQTDLQEMTQQLSSILKNNYGQFDQDDLITLLYQMYGDKSNTKSSSTEKKSQNHTKNHDQKQQNSLQKQKALGTDRQDTININRIKHTIKIFVQYGYGINIAKRHSSQGENILPNPYNNLVGKCIKDAWKLIQTEVAKVKKIKFLATADFNRLKTPLVNSKKWLKQEYLKILNKSILYQHGLSSDKPSTQDFISLHQYLVQKVKPKKGDSDKKSHVKKSKFIQKNQDQSSDEFKPQLSKYKMNKYGLNRYQDIERMVKNSIKTPISRK